MKKLGIKPGFRVRTKNAPANYLELIAPLPGSVLVSAGIRTRIDLWHIFTKSRVELASHLPVAIGQIRQNGMIWASWPKKASKVVTDVTEDVVREVALPLGIVDVKVCAIDSTWSGLKLVIRKENRR